MTYFGYNTVGGSSDTTATNWVNEAGVGASMRYTAVTGDRITEVAVYGGGTGTAEVGVYTFSGGVPVTKVGSATLPAARGDGTRDFLLVVDHVASAVAWTDSHLDLVGITDSRSQVSSLVRTQDTGNDVVLATGSLVT